jgi:AcrR family transcriptional regulator
MAAKKRKSGVEPVSSTQRAPRRGPKPGFSTTEIARAAIRLADAKGLEAVTMQRVAGELGLTTMALYRYFPGKADLVAAMIDSASDAAPDLGKTSLPWKTRLQKWARLCASIYRSHPWFLEATSIRRSPMGPNELTWMEAVLALLAEAGLAPRDCHCALLAIIGHVRGYATFQQIKKTGGSKGEWLRALDRLLQADGHGYPTLRAVVRSGAFSGDPDAAFDFGLSLIVDGIEIAVRKRKMR